ncbi:MAG: tRNA(Ile)-lysidine synthetase [Sodalis sp. Fle]|nr:MAG: tRNA(Ile)-lysidine synthetase [Sodalis sp. Fle]
MNPKFDAPTRVFSLRQQAEACIVGHRRLLLAFSGGLDSTVLLDVLTAWRNSEVTSADTKFPLNLRAIHVHHGICQHADHWAEHCAQQCQLRGVPFNVIFINLDKNAPDGIESAARHTRYQVLRDNLLPHEVLVTAQHLDDQAETLLLALKRGSGPAGLAAMAANAPYYGHRLLRPLLACHQTQLEMYAHEHHLNWIEDDSNKDIHYDRSFIRSHILPPMRQRWPWFSEAVARSAQLCAEQEALLDELLADTLATLTQPDGSLQLMELLPMSAPRRRALLRRWLANSGARMASRKKLDHIWQEVVLSRRDSASQLQLDDLLLRRFCDRLYLLPIQVACPLDKMVLHWPSVKTVLSLPQELGVLIRHLVPTSTIVTDEQTSLPENLSPDTSEVFKVAARCVIRAPLFDEQVSVRFGSVSGLQHIVGRHRGRSLKKLWQELKIPPWLRRRTPLLFYNQTLIAVLGVFITQKGEAKKQNRRWQLYWLQKQSCHFHSSERKR